MVRISAQNGLKEPEFIQEDSFCTILYRPVMSTGEVTGEVTGGVTGEVTGEVKKLLKVLAGEMKRSEIQDALQLRHDDNFRTQYILPALEAKIIEMTFPQSPNHPNQKYRLTDNGRRLKQNISNSDTICQQGHVYL